MAAATVLMDPNLRMTSELVGVQGEATNPESARPTPRRDWEEGKRAETKAEPCLL